MGSAIIPMETRVKLYGVAVGSLFTYGCEGWALTAKILRRLNGANSKLLSHFTGKQIREEARPATTSYNLTLEIRKCRLCWLGHILRMPTQRLVRNAVIEQLNDGKDGNILMDAPTGAGMRELMEMAFENNKRTWRGMVKALT